MRCRDQDLGIVNKSSLFNHGVSQKVSYTNEQLSIIHSRANKRFQNFHFAVIIKVILDIFRNSFFNLCNSGSLVDVDKQC